MPRLDEHDDPTPKEVADALRRPDSFGLSRDHPHADEMFATWSLGPVSTHRDASLREESNHHALLAHLRSDPTLDDDWCLTTAGHWAVGWVTHLSFRALDAEGRPTRIFRVLRAWWGALADYPVADDADYQRRIDAATLANVRDEGKRHVASGAPEDWPARVDAWLKANDPEAYSFDEVNGYWPSEAGVRGALAALGWLYEEDDDDDQDDGT